MQFHRDFLSLLATRYPETARSLDLSERVSPLLICPEVVRLPGRLKAQAKAIVRAFFALRNTPDWFQPLQSLAPAVADPNHFSVLMSYDFHVDSKGDLRLIEINTNASLSLLVALLHEKQGVPNRFSPDFVGEIVECFRDEARLAGREVRRAAIVDESPEAQRLFVEFSMYRELFEKRGWSTEILDPRQLDFERGGLEFAGEKIDLIYNRHTDFYLQTDETRALREALANRSACVTPHPHEYRLLADKARLLELSRPSLLDSSSLDEAHKAAIRSALIQTVEVDAFEPDALWAERKKWFFKPSQSYGGKAVYRGTSLSRTTFNKQVLSGGYLAQENVPAPAIVIPIQDDHEKTSDEFKYDLRFYAYKDRIQLACARLYKGQTTNSQTLGGGAAVIDWQD